jgi:chemotaxis protein methyltransferase CheR
LEFSEVKTAALRRVDLGDPTLSDRNFARLAEFIKGYSGIKMPSGKNTMLEGRLRRRMRATGIEDVNDYCNFLFDQGGLETELVHLINAVTTNKTDFFREPYHFEFMANQALPTLYNNGRRRFKAWSAACSNGAEPYTIAMVLDEFCEDRRDTDYSILGTDLSTEVIEQAVAGIYQTPMIEPVSMVRRKKFLMRSTRGDKVRIVPKLRAKNRFARLNLMDESYPVDRDMDMIFCRNILIYFDKAGQEAVLKRLCSHLRHGGYLFMGHSESITGFDLPVEQIASTVFRRR